MVPAIAQLWRRDLARRAEQVEQEVAMVAPGRMRQLGHEGLGRERMLDVVDRAQPADAGMGFGGRVLDADVGDGVGQVDQAQAQLEPGELLRVGREDGQDGRLRRTLQPGGDLALRVQPRLQMLGGDGVEVVVVQVVVAGPGQLDRLALQLLGDQRRLDGEVGLGLAPEAATQQRDVDGHLVDAEPEPLGHALARGLGRLHRGPDLTAAVDEACRRGRRLHRRVGQMGHVVVGRHTLGRLGQRRLRVAVVAHRLAGWLGDRRLQRLAEGHRVVAGMRPIVPNDLQGLAALDGGPGVLGHDDHAAQRLELGRRWRACDLEHLDDAGQPQRVRRVERFDLAAKHRRPGDHGVEHAGQPRVDAVLRAAGDDHLGVHQIAVLLADVAEILGVLEPQRLALGHVQFGGSLGQRAVAQAPAAGLVRDHMVDGLHLGDRHTPLLRRGECEHLPRCGAAAAHRHEPVPHAARAVGVLVAVFLFIARRLHDLDLGPVGLQFVGQHPGQAGAHTLAHLRSVHDDADRAVRRNRHEGARAVLQAMGHGVATELGGFVRAGDAGQADAEHQAGQRQRTQQRTAAQAGIARQCLGEEGVHAAPPSRPAAVLIALRMRV
mmetsp:Transcript_15247/g.42032  ORF Transcript_15247/g.42032 Transcript_15247/m.42032 type:complete len:605 (-) Transcript_15247:1321-3135(-)